METDSVLGGPSQSAPTDTPPAEPSADTPPAATPDAKDTPDGDPPKPDPKDGLDTPKDEPKKEGAPEAYADFALPEGFTPNAERLDAFKGLAKELGLTQENAQRALDYYLGQEKAGLEAREKAFNDTVNGWKESMAKDAEYGGEKWAENSQLVRNVVGRFGGPELAKVLNETGMGNHPELVRFVYRIGKAIAEDAPPTPGTSAGAKVPTEELFYTSGK